jgi:mRNA degradation ribonuclease J1/J2
MLSNPTNEIDVDFLVFVERYATDLLKWDVLTFFARHAEDLCSAAQVAERIGRNIQFVRPELGDLMLVGVLDQIHADDNQIFYKLTQNSRLRDVVLKLASKTSGF